MQVINFLAEKYYKIAYDTFFYIEDSKKTHKYINLALEIEPKHIKALRLLGVVFLFEDKIKEALLVWQKLYNMGEEDFEVFSKLAFCYGQTGEYNKAFEFCEKSALTVDLGDFDKMCSLYKLKIDLLLDTKKPKSAFKLFKNALKNLGFNQACELKNCYTFGDFYIDPVIELKNRNRAF